MIGFIQYSLILAAALSGMTGQTLWLIPCIAAALSLTSYYEYGGLFDRASEIDCPEVAKVALSTLIASYGNALIAIGGAYAMGTAIMWVS